jgi:outer membrane protein OmpA-like peptidoglycan-associated protein
MNIASARWPVFAAFLVAACSDPNSRKAALDRSEQREHAAEENARQARHDADKVRVEAGNAREQAREATRAEQETERNAQWAARQALLAERHEKEAQVPRKGSTELQRDSQPSNERVGILFAADQAELSPDAKARLDAFAKTVRANVHEERVVVEGYADDYVGAEPRNVDLSRRRADAVVDYLATKGLAKDRIHHESFGSRNTIGERDTGLNQRVEVVIEPRHK